MENRDLGYKVDNPFVQVLLRHLTVEAEIFKVKKDFYSLNWVLLGLTGLNRETKDLIGSSVKSLEKEKKIIEKFYDGIISDLRKKQEEKIRIWKEKKKKAHNSRYVEIRDKYRKEVDKYEEKILEIQEKNFEELNNYFETKQRRVREIENQYKLKTRVLLYSAALVIIK